MDASSSSGIQFGGRAIDRYNPIICDERRSLPCRENTNSSSQGPLDLKPHHHQPKKSWTTTTIPNDSFFLNKARNSSKKPREVVKKISTANAKVGKYHRPDSSRYLLSDDTAFMGGLADEYDSSVLEPAESNKINYGYPSSPQSDKSSSDQQVVVLKVALHCKGCEGKVRKHLSKMKGVKSFNIDFAAKKVTIVGDITPVSALATMSKVKSAQFWTSSICQPTTPAFAASAKASTEK